LSFVFSRLFSHILVLVSSSPRVVSCLRILLRLLAVSLLVVAAALCGRRRATAIVLLLACAGVHCRSLAHSPSPARRRARTASTKRHGLSAAALFL